MSNQNTKESYSFPPPPNNLGNYSSSANNSGSGSSSTLLNKEQPTVTTNTYNSAGSGFTSYSSNNVGSEPTYAQPHQENPPVSTMDTILSKGKVYTEQASHKISELNEHYKITETVKKSAHDAKPKIKSGFNLLKSKFNDFVDGRGTHHSGTDYNPSMVATSTNTPNYQSQTKTADNYQVDQQFQK